MKTATNFTLSVTLEALVLTGSFSYSGTGLNSDNTITGNTSINQLYGLEGNDTLYGGAATGADTLDGGNDTCIVDNVEDATVEVAASGTYVVNSTIPRTLGAEVENLVLSCTDNLNGISNILGNVITGNAGDKELFGMDGNDSLIERDGDGIFNGSTGNDAMTGGTGDAHYYMDSVTDKVFEASIGRGDSVISTVRLTLARYAKNLMLAGTTAISSTGNIMITGNTGANHLYGKAGGDQVFGGLGNDTMSGGTGTDHFIFTAATGNSTDTITDFNALVSGAGQGDVLEFRGLLHGIFVYLGTAAITGGSDNSEAEVVGSTLQINVDGSGVADITLTMTGLTTANQLGATDLMWGEATNADPVENTGGGSHPPDPSWDIYG